MVSLTKPSSSRSRGFTLVEILVALAIFSVVMISTLGAFLKMIDVNKKIQSVRTAMDNANLAVETISRNIRLGTNYACFQAGQGIPINEPPPQDCLSGGPMIGFESQRGIIGYAADQVYYQRNPSTSRIERIIGGQNIPLTAPDVIIESLVFYVEGSQPLFSGDELQPRVRIVVSGRTNLQKNDLNFNFKFQTIATQRLLDS